jgi:crotonobetainyl-CoA:carnitine CoA-transferase CaiB-like acyl-CoA transferase
LGFAITDVLTGLYATQGILSAILLKERQGVEFEGLHI